MFKKHFKQKTYQYSNEDLIWAKCITHDIQNLRQTETITNISGDSTLYILKDRSIYFRKFER